MKRTIKRKMMIVKVMPSLLVALAGFALGALNVQSVAQSVVPDATMPAASAAGPSANSNTNSNTKASTPRVSGSLSALQN